MPCILHIETATEVCSVAVSKDNEIIFYQEETQGPSHARVLGVFTEQALKDIRQQHIPLDAMSVSCGPGSYTGLRIGVSEAKGLCYGLDIPLIAIPTLELLAGGLIIDKAPIPDNTLLCPMIDARRMEVYNALYRLDLTLIREVRADIIDNESFAEYLQDYSILFFGNGVPKCKAVLNNPNAVFVENIYPSARNMAVLAEKYYTEKQFVDTAYFEPFYLKEFVTTTPRNKVLLPHKS